MPTCCACCLPPLGFRPASGNLERLGAARRPLIMPSIKRNFIAYKRLNSVLCCRLPSISPSCTHIATSPRYVLQIQVTSGLLRSKPMLWSAVKPSTATESMLLLSLNRHYGRLCAVQFTVPPREQERQARAWLKGAAGGAARAAAALRGMRHVLLFLPGHAGMHSLPAWGVLGLMSGEADVLLRRAEGTGGEAICVACSM